VFPDDWSVQQMRSAVADWFSQYDKLIRLKKTDRGIVEGNEYLKGITK
jgi:hypothetical protein